MLCTVNTCIPIPCKGKTQGENGTGLSQTRSLSLSFFHTEINSLLLCARYEILFSFGEITPKGERMNRVQGSRLFFFLYPLMSILAVSSGLVLLEITLQQQLVNSSFFSATYTERKLRQVKPLEFDERREKIIADCCIPFAFLAYTCLEFGSVACHIASRSSLAFLMSFSHFCVARTTRQRSENVTQ